MYYITLFTTSYVLFIVGSNCPLYEVSQLTTISANYGLLPQDWVCAGVSISGINLIPLVFAYWINYLTSFYEYIPPIAPYSDNSGCVLIYKGKLS